MGTRQAELVLRPLWLRFLKVYEGHSVLTLSVLNAASLFIFALLGLFIWAGGGSEVHATGQHVRRELPPEPPSRKDLSETSGSEVQAPLPPVSRSIAGGPRTGQSFAGKVGKRDYPVELRPKLQVFTEEDFQPPGGRSGVEPDWASDIMDMSEGMPLDPQLGGNQQ